MGLFLSFLGGAAQGFSEEVEKSEKEAKAYAAMATKSLYEQKVENDKANVELNKSLLADKNFILANKKDATPDQINALLSNPEVMKKYRAYENPSDVDLNNLIKVVKANPSVAVAAENVEAFPELQNKAKEVLSTIQKKRTGLGGFIDSMGERAGGTAAAQTATALGTTMEALQGSKRLARPTSDATFDMKVFDKPETFAKAEDKAKVDFLNAQKSGDVSKLAEAKAVIDQLNIVSDQFTDAQKQFANESAQVRKDYLFGTTAERAAAKPKYDKLMADLKAEAQAKKIGEGSGESSLPKLSTLNAFAGSAASRVVSAKYGNLLNNKQLALVEKPDGSTDFRYTGDDAALRKEINLTAYNAVKSALSMYTDAKGNPATRDVASVLNSYAATIQSVVKREGALSTEPPEPAAPPPSPTAAKPTVVPSSPVQPTPSPKTQAEYNALRPGTEYMDTDGKVKRKGGN